MGSPIEPIPLGKHDVEWCMSTGNVTKYGYKAGVVIFEYRNDKSKAHFYFYENPVVKPTTQEENP